MEKDQGHIHVGQVFQELEDVHAYINIKKSRMDRIAFRFLAMPCVEVMEWIIIG